MNAQSFVSLNDNPVAAMRIAGRVLRAPMARSAALEEVAGVLVRSQRSSSHVPALPARARLL